MYQTSEEYKTLVYEPSTRHLLQVYIDGVEVEAKYILDFKTSQTLFENDEFTLGSVTSKEVDLKLYKSAVPETIETIYITSGIRKEIVPIGYFHVETMEMEDDYTVSLKLRDSMVNFEFNYDGSEWINSKEVTESEETEESTVTPVTLLQLIQDICLKGGVELRFYFFFKYG